MAKTRTLLSPKAFIAYCTWMGVGIAVMLVPWLLPLWVLVGVLGLGLLWHRRNLFPPLKTCALKWRLPQQPELHKRSALSARLLYSGTTPGVFTQKAQMLSPNSRLLRFRYLRTELPLEERDAEDSASMESGVVVEADAHRLGFETISEATLELTSSGGLWKRLATLPLSEPLSFRVSPSLPPPSRERFKALIASAAHLNFR